MCDQPFFTKEEELRQTREIERIRRGKNIHPRTHVSSQIENMSYPTTEEEYYSPHSDIDTTYMTARPNQRPEELVNIAMPMNIGVRPSIWASMAAQIHEDGVYESSD